MKKEMLIFKFNGGNGAVLCNNCHVIIHSGSQIPPEMWDAATHKKEHTYESIGPQFCCEKCKEEFYNNK
jgi:hypothetical protein